MRRWQLAGLLSILLTVLSAGCSKKTANDDALANDIKAKLYSDATTKPANINVAVSDGVVTLTGDVPSSDVELAAMKVVNGTAGVRSVSDQLKVNSAMTQLPDAGTPPGQPPADNTSAAAPSNTSTSKKPSKSASAPASSAVAQNEPPPPAPSSESAPPPIAPPAAPPVSQPAPTNSPAPAAEPPRPVELTIPSGTSISVRTIDSIDSKRNEAGQTFRATLTEPLMADGEVAVPAGTAVSVLLAQERDAGRIRGQSMLEVRLASLEFHGRSYKLDTTSVTQEGKARGKSTAVRTGIGAAAGAVIGAIAGGGKGAAIGSAAGGGAGLGVNVFTHGQQVQIPSETVLMFTLQGPVTIEKRR